MIIWMQYDYRVAKNIENIEKKKLFPVESLLRVARKELNSFRRNSIELGVLNENWLK